MDGCHRSSRFLDHCVPASRELIVGGKQHPWVRPFGQRKHERPVLQPFETQLGHRGGYSPAVTKLRADSGRQTLVDNDFQYELCGSEIRIDGFKPANSVVDLSRF